ncbi:hypothetical protein QBC46DRAFT_359552 [Diplogelasinospora grovesii]|uniref:Uncharacterized protein n=1 Tax=Diplogelasinospora grovesii TaxID=303347 RepID=A0AAN6MUK7_9PEZI|nr:hypothetical protein QBC46DRAFT_359552 [Diplogelasinospora grovesii]
MRDHCQKEHGWQNPRKRGRPTGKTSEALPWIEGVRCQRFFPSRQASGWFEVERGSEDAEEGAGGGETVEQWMTWIHQQKVARFEAKKRQIEAPDDKKEPNPWLQRLRASIRSIQEDKAVLQRVWESCTRVLEQAKAVPVPQLVGHAVLFEINRKEAQVKAKKPFDSRMEEDTWARYKEVMGKLVCYAHRTYEWEERQERLFNKVIAGVKAAMEGGEAGPEPLRERSDQRVVMGLREDGGWVPAEEYTPIYSAVIKVARMLVVYQAVTERAEQIKAKESIMSQKEARRAVAGLFRLVRAKAQRFMMLVGPKSEPSPMDWIFDARTYGMKIRYTTAAGGSID